MGTKAVGYSTTFATNTNITCTVGTFSVHSSSALAWTIISGTGTVDIQVSPDLVNYLKHDQYVTADATTVVTHTTIPRACRYVRYQSKGTGATYTVTPWVTYIANTSQ